MDCNITQRDILSILCQSIIFGIIFKYLQKYIEVVKLGLDAYKLTIIITIVAYGVDYYKHVPIMDEVSRIKPWMIIVWFNICTWHHNNHSFSRGVLFAMGFITAICLIFYNELQSGFFWTTTYKYIPMWIFLTGWSMGILHNKGYIQYWEIWSCIALMSILMILSWYITDKKTTDKKITDKKTTDKLCIDKPSNVHQKKIK
jgi:hypothetical protein